MRCSSLLDAHNFRVVHVSIQAKQAPYLFVIEASDRMALARGMHALQISAAKHINRAFSKRRAKRRRGQVFCDRYDAEIITNRRRRATARVRS